MTQALGRESIPRQPLSAVLTCPFMNGSHPDTTPPGRIPGDLLSDLAADPAWFLRDVDPIRGQAIFSPMDEASYRASIFLDNRIKRAGPRDLAVDLDGLLRLAQDLDLPSRRIHYIFHIGHCGSTLMSTVLGGLDGFLALREPPMLMGLSRSMRHLEEPGFPISRERWDQLFELALALLGRTWRPTQTALIKPTSHAGNLIPLLMNSTGWERGLLLHVGLETYLTTMLRSEVRRETMLFAKDFRLRDFVTLMPDLPDSVESYRPGQLAAMSWLLHAREFATAMDADALRERTLGLDFDCFLADPQSSLHQVCEFFSQTADDTTLQRLLDMHGGRSAKDPGRSYDYARRQAELSSARQAYADEINAGLRWAEQMETAGGPFSGLRERLG